ncbi:ABC transporter ATP-binding protein [Paenibacillus mendelii]|uniref:ATP-binding cassette domain-containing protein n=1 Tax=Paenibacillus mendelii TaxID=206163 RepID=A0ABV6JEC0_9BACL|nr:ATP-binding cassette domain-containing protein [Paenibacillus mendelii]MCQ6557108.1 ATP-binding cassette domain-containing protein [Paenibacillus mendelii]
MIIARNLCKTFKLTVPKEGRFKGIRNLFASEYREVNAVKDVTLSIGSGEFVGYIGPNGAGKSTTIKMLSGILHPTSGDVLICGASPQQNRRQVVRQLGVVFGQRSQLWWDLPVRDSYDILASMYKLDAPHYKEQLATLRNVLQLDEFIDTPVRKLSLGQRMRADLAAALLHNPAILFLDEPTIGLDVVAKKQIRTYLKHLNVEWGKTILLTTHDMDDIEQLCSRVIVINRGEAIYDGSIENLQERIGLPSVMKLAFRGPVTLPAGRTEMLPFKVTDVQDNVLTIECNRNEVTAMEVLRNVSEWGDLLDVHIEEPDFEDIIHRVY